MTGRVVVSRKKLQREQELREGEGGREGGREGVRIVVQCLQYEFVCTHTSTPPLSSPLLLSLPLSSLPILSPHVQPPTGGHHH